MVDELMPIKVSMLNVLLESSLEDLYAIRVCLSQGKSPPNCLVNRL